MKWIKKIAQMLTGFLATTTLVGCKSETPTCIYGPPPVQTTEQNTPENSDAALDAPENSDAALDAPENSDAALDAPENSDTAQNAPENSDAALDAPENSDTVQNAPENSDAAQNADKSADDMKMLKDVNLPDANMPVAIYGPLPDLAPMPMPVDDNAKAENPKTETDAENQDEVRREIEELKKTKEPAIRALYGVRPPTLRQ